MKRLLLQLDSSPLPSVFDRIVGYDGGAEEVMSYGGVTEGAVRDLTHGAIFTRGPKDLHNTAIFIGGTDIAVGERMLAAVRKAFFGPLRVSVMLDANGANTTAVAAVAKMAEAVGGELRGRRALVMAGAGPVGRRAAGLLARAGAEVAIAARPEDDGEGAATAVGERFGGSVRTVPIADALAESSGAELLLNAGPAGVQLVPRAAWAGRSGLRVAVDLNAVPPLGIGGIEPGDAGVERDGVTVFGAIGVGNFKMKVHKTCIARLFERNDLVLDAESIDDVARELAQAARAG